MSVFLLSFLIFWGCKKEDPTYPFEQENITKEGLTFEEDSFIASLPSIIPKPSEIVLGNGETIESFLNRTDPNALPNWGHRPLPPGSTLGDDHLFRFITALTSAGNSMITNTEKFDEIPDVTENGIPYKQPLQFGYGYVYNGDIDLTKRKTAGNCKLKLYGIDCSGMTTLMLINAGANPGTGRDKNNAANLASEEVLNGALLTSALSDFNYEYEDKPASFLPQATTGDVIYFKKAGASGAFHIALL